MSLGFGLLATLSKVSMCFRMTSHSTALVSMSLDLSLPSNLWNCTDLGREDAELHKRIRVSAVTAEVSSQTLLDLYESERDQVREEFLFCTGQNEERLFLSRKAEDEDPWYCGGRDDCKPGKQRGRYK